MIVPPSLKKNDKLAIVAPARSATKADLQEGIKLAESWGFEVELGSSIGLVHHQFAGNDSDRAADFQDQINNPSIKAIWCAKGGYGCVRILDLLDFSSLQEHPKWIIGYSDITSIHCHLQTLGIASLHAQMPVGILNKTAQSASTLKETLIGNNVSYHFPYHPFNQFGEVSACVVGGNLSVLYSLCGSKSFPSFQKVILLLEDLDEYLYHIDRMMQNFKRNGVFDNLAGIIVGGMTAMKDNPIPFGFTAEEIINQYTSKLKIPVAFGAPIGHQQENLALPVGKKIHLKVTQQQTEIHF